MTNRSTILSLVLATVLGSTQGSAVRATPIIVPGQANPWLANGTTASNGSDTVPAQAPVLISLQDIAPGDELVFTATGSVSYSGSTPTDPPDGDSGSFRSLFHNFDATNGGPENSIGG